MTAVQHPRHDLDNLLTHAVRFSIVAALAQVDKADFAAVRDSVQISAPTLSKQVALLEGAGYVGVEKGRVGRQPRTWLSLTDIGKQTYDQHLTALRRIARLPG